MIDGGRTWTQHNTRTMRQEEWGDTTGYLLLHRQCWVQLYIFFAGNDRYYSPDMSSWENLRSAGRLSRITADTLQLSSLWRGDTNLPGLCDEIDGAMCPLSRCHGAGEAATEERGGETWLREYKSGHQAVNTRGGSPGNTTEGDKVNISLN